MNDFIKEYFSLTNNEQRGIISLVLIILFVFIGTRLYLLSLSPKTALQNNTHLLAFQALDSLALIATEESISNSQSVKLFPFDPNKVSKENLLLLGVKENVANTLINYRSKGGRFYKAEDLSKVYGISDPEYQRLKDFIHIETQSNLTPTYTAAKKTSPYTTQTFSPSPSKKELFVPIELNGADSSALTTVQGIGPVYASRIIKYRNLLGGFYKKEQLLEVYGIDEEVYNNIAKQLKLESNIIPLKVNGASWYELKSHPYISSDLANILLNYVKAHGIIENLEDLESNQLIDKETVLKINPYLSFDE